MRSRWPCGWSGTRTLRSRLPLAFTALFALVALALFLVLLFNLTSDTIWATIAGYVAFGAAAIGVYVFFDAMGQATGGKALSLGNPVLH